MIYGGWGHAPQKFFWCFRALRQLLVQSEAKSLIELLNICGGHTNLFFHLRCMHVQKVGGGGGGGQLPPLSYTTDYAIDMLKFSQCLCKEYTLADFDLRKAKAAQMDARPYTLASYSMSAAA